MTDLELRGSAPDPDDVPTVVIPLPSVEAAVRDPEVLPAWHQVLADLVGAECPHSLFALWLYPAAGGSLLLGPRELEGHLEVPLPAPRLPAEGLEAIEARLVRAGYESVALLPVPVARRDVGLLLVADFPRARYLSREREYLAAVAERLGPVFGRLAARVGPGGVGAGTAPAGTTTVLPRLADLVATARAPLDLVVGFSELLRRDVPHDRVELLVRGAGGAEWYRFGRHARGPLLRDEHLVVRADEFDPQALFGDLARLRLDDVRQCPAWPRRSPFGWGDPALDLRSLLGVRLLVGDTTVGYLLVAGAGTELYDEHDLQHVARLAPLLAPRVHAALAEAELERQAAHFRAMRGILLKLHRISETMAEHVDISEGLKAALDEAAALLPYYRCRFALRVGQRDQLAVLAPGERTPLAHLPVMPATGTTVATVLEGTVPWAVSRSGEHMDAIFPLRTAGQVNGALILTAREGEVFTTPQLTLAQQLADLVAPHVELLRRAALQAQALPPTWDAPPAFWPRGVDGEH